MLRPSNQSLGFVNITGSLAVLVILLVVLVDLIDLILIYVFCLHFDVVVPPLVLGPSADENVVVAELLNG